MSDFKLKINFGNANIELEGEGELVKEILLDLKANGLGELSKCYDLKQTVNPPNYQGLEDPVNVSNIQDASLFAEQLCTGRAYPPVKDIVLKNLTKTEPERVLIFAFYASNHGAKPVSKDDIKEQYLSTDLWTNSVRSNLTYNIKSLIKDNYISTYNASSYILTSEGKEQAENIIFSTSTSTVKNKTNGKKKPTKYEAIEMDLNSEEKRSLLDLFTNHQPKSNIDKIMLVSYWLNENKGSKIISKDLVFTILKNANVSVIFSIQDALTNAKRKNYLFATSTKGELELSHIGEEYLSKELLAGA